MTHDREGYIELKQAFCTCGVVGSVTMFSFLLQTLPVEDVIDSYQLQLLFQLILLKIVLIQNILFSGQQTLALGRDR